MSNNEEMTKENSSTGGSPSVSSSAPQKSPGDDAFCKREIIDLDAEFEGLTLIGEDDEIYPVKVHKYKEVKHYIKGEVLGRGKFGTVREFIDKRTLKRFAGKIVKRYLLRKDSHLRRQINKEFAITYHFDHPNILRIYDLFSTKEKIYMFMEYCFGELSEFLKEYNTLPVCQAKDYFGQIVEGLDYLHSHGIIHRDIKPDNVLITHGNAVKLADFGVFQEVSYFTADDLVGGNDGTPIYHPPELFNQAIFRYSGSKIDIWAAGVVLYQMTTGKLPFLDDDNMDFQERINEILHKNATYPPEVVSDILLVDLFNKLFEKDFKKRISISNIKKHPWMQQDYTNEPYLPFPTESRSIDCYRGLTVLTRIYNKYYPPATDNKRVNYKAAEASRKMLPLMRGSRYTEVARKVNPNEGKRPKINFI